MLGGLLQSVDAAPLAGSWREYFQIILKSFLGHAFLKFLLCDWFTLSYIGERLQVKNNLTDAANIDMKLKTQLNTNN